MNNKNSKTFANIKNANQKNGKVKFAYLRFALGISSSGSFVTMSAVSQGTTNYTRTGDLIRLGNLQFNYLATYGDAVGNPMRIVIFQTVGGFAPTTLADLFAYGGTSSEDVTSQFLPNLIGRRIHLLYDEMIVMNPNGSNGNTVRRGWLKPKVPEIEFNAGATSVINGQIYCVAITDSAAIPHPGLSFSMEIPFTDC